jgi:non-heme chloroperoxidase
MQDNLSSSQSNGSTQRAAPLLQHKLQTRDGVNLHYIDWGQGEPILFVNSWCFTVKTWAPAMYYFSAIGRRCVSFDRRGHGRSQDPGRGYDFDTLADDLADVISQLDLKRVTLVGHSMGCAEIVRYLSRHGSSQVDRIVLTSTTTPFLMKTDDNPMGIDRALLDSAHEQMKDDFPRWLSVNARPFVVEDTCQTMIDWIINEAMQTSMKALLDCNLAIISTDFRAELKRIQVPTMVIHGNADVSSPIGLTGEVTAAGIPGALFKAYPLAPHGIVFTHTAQLNADIAQFLASGDRCVRG